MEKMNDSAFRSLFWLVFYSIFDEKKKPIVHQLLKNIFAQNYGLFFLKLTTYDKDRNLMLVPFILAHAYINGFYEQFPSSRSLFSRDFGLKVFRLWIFEILGITVSTTYIETFIKKWFKDDLLAYIDMATDKNGKFICINISWLQRSDKRQCGQLPRRWE